MELLTSPQLPKNLEKTISDLARAREKSAKQKYLLDLGESLVMHLCSFVLGEYKAAELVSIDLEKSFLNNSKSVSFGVYLGWLREASKFLNAQKRPSEIQALLHGSHDFEELSKFIKAFEALKKEVEQESEEYHQAISTTLKNNLGKVNFLQFFDIFIQLRNRVAHPHKEVKGKMVSWPFSEAYFDAINPYLEAALNKTISELNKIWEFRQYIVDSNEEGKLILLSEESGEFTELENAQDFQEGVRVVANDANTVLLSDWKWLLRAGEEALAKIKQEEDDLRNKATIQDLQEAIKAALEDGQISLEELNFFESLGKTKMGLSKPEIKQLILEVAKKMEIEDPFPEVDKRFIEVIDQAITTKTYNEFLLKLTGQQYGVDNETFEKVFLERTFALNVDPEAVKKNRVLQFTSEEFVAVQGLMNAHKWILDTVILGKNAKESVYKVTGNSEEFGTKEFWHKTAFLNLEKFVNVRLKSLDLEWDTNQNKWNIGNLTSFAWCSLYPKNLMSKRLLALHVTIYGPKWLAPGFVAIGFLPDWKDLRLIENYGLLNAVFVEHLKSFAHNYSEDLKKYPNLLLWDSLNNSSYYTFTHSMREHPWFYNYLFDLDQIQFVHSTKEIVENPYCLIESFDISISLFQGIFDAVERDYKNMIGDDFLLNLHEQNVRKKLCAINPLLEEYGLLDAVDQDETDNEPIQGDEEFESNNPEATVIEDGLKGKASIGYVSKVLKPRVKGYPLALSFTVKQNYLENRLDYLIYISCAGYLVQEIHRPIEKVLESMVDLQFENTKFHFKRSKFLAVMSIDDVNAFDPIPLTSYFLNQLATRCARTKTPFLGLKISAPLMVSLLPHMDSSLDHVKKALEIPFGKKIKVERNWMRGSRYLDFVPVSKKSQASLGWGFQWTGTEVQAGVIYQIQDSVADAEIVEALESKHRTLTDWKWISETLNDEYDPMWLLHDNHSFTLSASSEHSNPHTVDKALMSNRKTYWAAKIKNSEQWWQLESAKPMVFKALKIAGSPNASSYMQQFHLSFSMNGTDWETISLIEGLVDGSEVKEIHLDKAHIAKFVRVQPTQYVGWPGFRIDFLGHPKSPAKIELQWLTAIENPEKLASVMLQVADKINEVIDIPGTDI